ncbi:MAG: hypothetical protein ACK4LB_11240 [Spirosomataceae bacterium]
MRNKSWINLLIGCIVIGVVNSACQQNQELISPANRLMILDRLEGKWVLKSSRPGFPADAPHVVATTNESYVFDVDKLGYAYYVNNKVKERGQFTLEMAINSSSNQLTITFSADKTRASLAFEEDKVVIGNRIPKGAVLFDYDDYHYFTKHP